MKEIVLASAQKALDAGIDMSDKTWLAVRDGKVVEMDWDAYVKDITRMWKKP